VNGSAAFHWERRGNEKNDPEERLCSHDGSKDRQFPPRGRADRRHQYRRGRADPQVGEAELIDASTMNAMKAFLDDKKFRPGLEHFKETT